MVAPEQQQWEIDARAWAERVKALLVPSPPATVNQADASCAPHVTDNEKARG